MASDEDKPLTPQQVRQKMRKDLIDYQSGAEPELWFDYFEQTKKYGRTYSLKLTEQQRETLLRCPPSETEDQDPSKRNWGPGYRRYVERSLQAQPRDRRSRS